MLLFSLFCYGYIYECQFLEFFIKRIDIFIKICSFLDNIFFEDNLIIRFICEEMGICNCHNTLIEKNELIDIIDDGKSTSSNTIIQKQKKEKPNRNQLKNPNINQTQILKNRPILSKLIKKKKQFSLKNIPYIKYE